MEEFKEEFLYHDWERLAELPEEDQNNKDLIMMVVKRHGLQALKYANIKFTEDRDILGLVLLTIRSPCVTYQKIQISVTIRLYFWPPSMHTMVGMQCVLDMVL